MTNSRTRPLRGRYGDDMLDAALDAALVATSCAYAHWLAEHKHAEPDWTWVEVSCGVGYVLGHAALRAWQRGGDWKAGQAEVCRSFVLGGIPIAAGEIAQWWRRRTLRRTFARKWGEE